MPAELPEKDVVLVGMGHTNAHVLRMWRMRPRRGARLICVSEFPVATYSGMLPGVLAGLYPRERMEIDLVRLCAAAGALLIVDRFTGLDPLRREVMLAGRPPVPFDILSIGIGSIPAGAAAASDGPIVPIKPMQTFLDRLADRTSALATEGKQTLCVLVVGAGAGGVEIALGLPRFLADRLPGRAFELTLVAADAEILPGALRSTARRALRNLEERGVTVRTGHRVTAVADRVVHYANGRVDDADLVLWATSAAPPPVLATLGLPTDGSGYLATSATLLSTSGAPIFAVGDAGSIVGRPTPKAGVYAVRQGPILWENMGRLLAGRELVEYTPQPNFLKLLSTGDGRAFGEYKGVSFEGRWCWWLKDRIDGRFMDMYQDYSPAGPMPPVTTSSEQVPPMRCAGCGGKVGGSVLGRVLERLKIPASDHVLLGLGSPDDAAVIGIPGGRPVTVTNDFFVAPLDDPFLVGRIAALNAASDAFAMGARPFAALATAAIPPGSPRRQEQLLFELLSGAMVEFAAMGATLAGGHTIEADECALGFTILADQEGRVPCVKGNLKAGDALLLTKPLGTGILLRALGLARLPWRAWSPLLDCMLARNAVILELIDEFGIRALTDVTGFGLAGHLNEMVRASQVAVELDLAAIPLLPEAAALAVEGFESSLAPANRSVEQAGWRAADSVRAAPAYSLFFDPQTSGGLLFGVARDKADRLLTRLRGRGFPLAAIIGRVAGSAGPQVTVRSGRGK